MKKSFFSLAAIVVILAVIVAGCSSGNTGSNKGNNGSKPGEQGAGKKVSIRLSTWAGADEGKELQAILDQLNAASTTYEITQDSNPAEYDTRIVTQLSGNSGSDLFWVNAQRAAQFAAEGVMLDITDYMKESDHPAGNVDDYYEASLQPFQFEDKLFGLPWLQQPVMMYVNKQLFDEANIAYPTDAWTWDDFMSAAHKLTVDTNGVSADAANFDEKNIKQWGFTVNGWPPAQMFIWQNGGDVIAEDFSSSPIDSPEALEALQFYADLVNGVVTPSQQIVRDRGFDQMFRNGQVAMFMGGAADDLDSTIDNVQAYMVPAGKNNVHATFGDILGMGINKKTKHPEVAFEALLDLSDAIHKWKIMPPRISLADLDILNEMHPKKAHSLEAIVASMDNVRTYRYFAKYPDWDNVFWNQLMDPIINAAADPIKLVPEVKPLLDNALNR